MESAIGPYRIKDLERMPEGERWELIEGHLVMNPPFPRLMHQKVILRLLLRLGEQLEVPGIASVFPSNTGLFLADHTALGPDLVVVSPERQERFSERGIEGAPDLVVEVLSRSTRKRDEGVKRRLYAQYGVREYWIVHPLEAWVEVLVLRDGTFVTEGEGRQTPPAPLRSGIFPDLAIPLSQLFAAP